MNGKYSVHFNCPDIESTNIVAKLLKALGYKDSGNIGIHSDETRYTQIVKYDNHFTSYSDSRLQAGFAFNIAESEELDAALAISAIQEGEKYYENEWIVFDGHEALKSDVLTIGKLYQLGGKYWNANDGFLKVKEDDRGRANGYGKNQNFLFHKASPEEIIEFYKQKYSKMVEDRKIIGYKLLKDTPTLKAGVEFSSNNTEGGWTYQDSDKSFAYWYTQKEIDEAIGWFEPIYKEEVKTETLVLGSRKIKVVINSKKQILTSNYSENIRIQSIRIILQILTESRIQDISISKEGLAAYINNDIQFIRIGCEVENNLFSIKELAQVISTYDKLNP